MRRAALFVGALALSLFARDAGAGGSGVPHVGADALGIVESRLANGLRVVVDDKPRIPMVALNLRFGVGSAADPPTLSGLTDLTARAMEHHTLHVPDGLNGAAGRAAASSWGYRVGLDMTAFYVEVPASNFEIALWILSDLLGFFVQGLDEELVAKQRDAVLATQAAHQADGPTSLAQNSVLRELFASPHPYHLAVPEDGVPQLGYARAADVRAHFLRHFVASNAALSISGDVRAKDAAALVQKYFGPIVSPLPAAATVPEVAPLDAELVTRYAARVTRPIVRIHWPTPALGAPGDAALDLIAGMMDGNRICALCWELVERRKAAASTDAHQASFELGSYFTVAVEAAPGHTAAELLDGIDHVVESFQNQPAPDDWLVSATAPLLTPKVLGMESSAYRASRYSMFALSHATALWIERDFARYSLTPAEVQDAARKFLPRDRRYVQIIEPSATAPAAGAIVEQKVIAPGATPP